MAILALQVDLDRLGVDVHVFVDDLEQLTTQQRQIVRAAARAALLRDDDAQTLLGNVAVGGLRRKRASSPISTSEHACEETPLGFVDEAQRHGLTEQPRHRVLVGARGIARRR